MQWFVAVFENSTKAKLDIVSQGKGEQLETDCDLIVSSRSGRTNNPTK
jgi:hypothetical protein